MTLLAVSHDDHLLDAVDRVLTLADGQLADDDTKAAA
jgi:ABC-type siderophore export system fused ATPase/permease subunit